MLISSTLCELVWSLHLDITCENVYVDALVFICYVRHLMNLRLTLSI